MLDTYVYTYYVVLKMTSIECILLENTFGLNRVHHQLEPTNQAIVLKSKWVEMISEIHFHSHFYGKYVICQTPNIW